MSPKSLPKYVGYLVGRINTLVGGSPRAWVVQYAVCAGLALIAIWGHAYPAGIDLPQHANLFQVLANYWDPQTGYAFFYDLDFYTPYSLIYIVAWPFAKWGGGLFAVKIILTFIALSTPLALRAWLRAVGAEPGTAILSFALIFSFAYLWGFLSFLLSAPISLFYLAAAARLSNEPSWKRLTSAGAWAVVLFFTHGATFTLVMAASGLACLCQRRLKKMAFELLQFLPALAVLVPWYLRKQAQATGGFREFADLSRFGSLFSGLVHPSKAFEAALIGLAVVSLLFALGNPTLARSPRRYLPFVLGFIGLFSVPEWVGETWLVGTRFVQFVYLYGLVAFEFRSDPGGQKRLQWLMFALSVLALGSINYRLWSFNHELDGLDGAATHIPKGSDLHLFVGAHESALLGAGQLGQVVAWIPTQQGGFLQNDSGAYWNNPVQRRRDLAWPTEFPFRVTRGTLKQARQQVGAKATLVASEGHFHVFAVSRTELTLPGLRLVRFGQTSGKPALDRTTNGRHFKVTGQPHAQGVGVSAQSTLQLRPAPGVRRLEGYAAVDDATTNDGAVRFRVFDASRRLLWKSPRIQRGKPAALLDVSLEGVKGDLFLVVDAAGGDAPVLADWLELRAVP